jgi:uncharacterized FAD-dependent dehydrogenase
MSEPEVIDAVVIGGGPSGMFAAWLLATQGASVALLESGRDMRASLCSKVAARMGGRSVRDAEKFRLQCHRCDCLTGLGGAAFHFDTNLGYLSGLSRSKIEVDSSGRRQTYSGLERALGGFDRASAAVAEVYRLMRRFGAQSVERATAEAGVGARGAAGEAPRGFDLADDATSIGITVDESMVMIDALFAEALAAGLDLRLGTTAQTVRRSPDGSWHVRTPSGLLRARNVIVGAGKLAVGWLQAVLDENGIEHRPSRRVDLGVRIEAPAEVLAPLTASCQNPKFTFVNEQGEPVRTFCVCERGRIMQYSFADTVLLDGQHCITTPTSRTNFGVITTVTVPDDVDGTQYAVDYARAVTTAGQGLPVAQSLLGLLGRPGAEDFSGTSLVRATWGDLAAVLGPQRVADIARMVDLLEDIAPGLLGPSSVVAAPVVERLYPALELSDDMQSSVPGLYFVGDSSSKIIGVTYGAATGLAAARSVLDTTGGAR